MIDIKAEVIKDFNATKTVWKNFVELLDASCLSVVSVYAIYEALQHSHEWQFKGLLLAGVVIALQAFILFCATFE
jgi:hypothetical protein